MDFSGTCMAGKQAWVPTMAQPLRCYGTLSRSLLLSEPLFSHLPPPAVCARGGDCSILGISFPILHWTSPALTPYQLCKPAVPPRTQCDSSPPSQGPVRVGPADAPLTPRQPSHGLPLLGRRPASRARASSPALLFRPRRGGPRKRTALHGGPAH